jgi:hypothetical protein
VRIRYGSVQLPRELPAGGWQLLDAAQIAELTLAASKPAAPSVITPPATESTVWQAARARRRPKP